MHAFQGVMRHLDIASGPPHKRPPNPTGGALNPSGRTNSRSGSRHSWSRGSAHGPSPPLAPSTPAGPSGARSLGSGLEVFAPFAHGTDALTGVAHGLHSSPMQQQLQLFGGPQAKNAPSWRPGVPTAEVCKSLFSPLCFWFAWFVPMSADIATPVCPQPVIGGGKVHG
eukprot:1158443-Pelagomonas_calceolata.AAC.21